VESGAGGEKTTVAHFTEGTDACRLAKQVKLFGG
jgi:hypothetical protein